MQAVCQLHGVVDEAEGVALTPLNSAADAYQPVAPLLLTTPLLPQQQPGTIAIEAEATPVRQQVEVQINGQVAVTDDQVKLR
jgi:hypothetical protein